MEESLRSEDAWNRYYDRMYEASKPWMAALLLVMVGVLFLGAAALGPQPATATQRALTDRDVAGMAAVGLAFTGAGVGWACWLFRRWRRRH